MMTLLTSVVTVEPLHFLLGFLAVVCIVAVIIIAIRWLMSLAGIAIPQPLLLILGILLFLVLLYWLADYSGVRWR